MIISILINKLNIFTIRFFLLTLFDFIFEDAEGNEKEH